TFIRVYCTFVLYYVSVTLSHYGKIGGPVREKESPSCRYGYFHSIRGCGRTKSNFFFLACRARFAGSGSCLYFSDCNSVYRCYFPTRQTWDGFWYLQYFPSLCLYVWGGYCWNFNKKIRMAYHLLGEWGVRGNWLCLYFLVGYRFEWTWPRGTG